MKRLVHDVGVNDSCYGDALRCPFYSTWVSMLKRCYSKIYQEKNRAYIECAVFNEWLVFSVFKSWMEEQNWKENELDKDILFNGNKIYSPETCIFVYS